MHTVRRILALGFSVYAVYIYSSALQQILIRDSSSIIARSYGGHLQFLTILSIVGSLAQQSLSVISLLTGLRSINALQSHFLMVTAPMEVVVSILYWPLKYINNDLVKDKRFGIKIDPELDRMCHLYPAIFQSLSATVFSQRTWRAGILGPLFLFGAVGASYWIWFEHTAAINGFYPYPLLAQLTPHNKLSLVSAAVVVALAFFKLIQRFQGLSQSRINS